MLSGLELYPRWVPPSTHFVVIMINGRHLYLGSTSEPVKRLHYMTGYTTRQMMRILCSVPFLDHEEQFPFGHVINP